MCALSYVFFSSSFFSHRALLDLSNGVTSRAYAPINPVVCKREGRGNSRRFGGDFLGADEIDEDNGARERAAHTPSSNARSRTEVPGVTRRRRTQSSSGNATPPSERASERTEIARSQFSPRVKFLRDNRGACFHAHSVTIALSRGKGTESRGDERTNGDAIVKRERARACTRARRRSARIFCASRVSRTVENLAKRSTVLNKNTDSDSVKHGSNFVALAAHLLSLARCEK